MACQDCGLARAWPDMTLFRHFRTFTLSCGSRAAVTSDRHDQPHRPDRLSRLHHARPHRAAGRVRQSPPACVPPAPMRPIVLAATRRSAGIRDPGLAHRPAGHLRQGAAARHHRMVPGGARHARCAPISGAYRRVPDRRAGARGASLRCAPASTRWAMSGLLDGRRAPRRIGASPPTSCAALSEDRAGARRHLHRRRQHVHLGWRHRGHRPGAGLRRGRSRRQGRAGAWRAIWWCT